MNYLQLKASLLVTGIGVEKSAVASLGETYKEQNHGLFGWDFESHKDILLPDDFLLPDGTVVQFRLNSLSPYIVKAKENERVLFLNDEEICTVKWINRPSFYFQKTSSGQDMVKIGQIGGEDCLFFCYQNYCSHFGKNKQCYFCNLVSTFSEYRSVMPKKDIQSIGEVAKTAWGEGMVKHLLLTGGCFSNEQEVSVITDILQSIRDNTGLERIPGTVLPSPAKGDDIERYYDTGIQAIGYSMEIWDDRLYQAICPGKSEATSHDEFVRSIEQAVNIFGPGNVYGVFVMGLETKETFLDGIRTLSGIGVNIVPFVWSPNPGSKFAGHRAPTPAWYFDTVMEAADIIRRANVPAGDENHCYRCDGNSLLHDALRVG